MLFQSNNVMKSRWNKKRKKWLDNNARRLAEKSSPIHSYVIDENRDNSDEMLFNKAYTHPRVTKRVPTIFSLTVNPEETICFINDLIDEIRNRQMNKTIKLDFIYTTLVTVDALIYIIAIMQNEKINKEMKYRFEGNLPNNANAARVIIESGFMDYVKSPLNTIPVNRNKKKIMSGKTDESEKSAQFCIFVFQHFNKDRKYTIPLQRVLIELMSNVAHHAYDKDLGADIANNWYMYAEYLDNRVRFVFVDTGVGIITTVRKKIAEKIFSFLGITSIDGEVLKSVFSGDFFRSETGVKHRGNGLKTVFEDVVSGPFEHFCVVTGKAICRIDSKTSEIQYETYSNSLHGTLFSFDYILR